MKKDCLKLIRKIQEDLCDKLGLILVPIKVENIDALAQLKIDENCIIISKNIINDELTCVAAIVHELRHEYQILSVHDNDESEPFINEWKEEFTTGKAADIYSYVEIDAYAFEKYYMNKKYNIDYGFDNKKLDKLTDDYIKNHLVKIDL